MLAVVAIAALLVVPPDRSMLHLAIGASGAALLGLIAALDGRGRLISQLLATVAVLGVGARAMLDHVSWPQSVMTLWIAVGAVLYPLWTPHALRGRDPTDAVGSPSVRGASTAALLALALAQLLGDTDRDHTLYGGLLLLLSWFPAWLPSGRGAWSRAARWLALLLPVVVVGGTVRAGSAWYPWLLAAGPGGLLLTTLLEPRQGERAGWIDVLTDRPAPLLVATFGTLCVVGTALLALPGISTRSGSLTLIDAAFTAVSAACVTGLIVLDTPRDFTPLGHLVILVLIQVGGIGIMTFSATLFSVLGRRMSLKHEATAAELLGARARTEILRSVRRILLVTAITEGVGAVLLTPLFVAHGDGLGAAVWRAVFTSVSAFCNAGFVLQSDSLIGYRHDPLLLCIVGAIVLIGGLGPLVVVAIPTWARGGPVSLHVRLAMLTTVGLVAVPWLLYVVLEWSATLDGLPVLHRVVHALFQVVSLRTAGFTSLDLSSLQPATWTLLILMMFVGGSPGSTAGGAKTTTLAVLLLAIAAAIRGQSDVRAWGRFIPHRTVQEAASIATVGVLACLAALVAVQLTQGLELSIGLFEVVSALATVGTSLGGTTQLDGVGKLIIIGCMFAGRVGPMTVLALLAETRVRGQVRYPEARVPLG